MNDPGQRASGKDNVLNPVELPGSAQVKSRSLSRPIHISSLLRALLHWCSPCRETGSRCLILRLSSRPSVATATQDQEANSLHRGHCWEHRAHPQGRGWSTALPDLCSTLRTGFSDSKRDPPWQQRLLSAGPQGLSQLVRQHWITLPDRTKLLPAPDTQQGTDL